MPVRTIFGSWLTHVQDFLLACYRRRDLRNLFVLALVLRLILLWESAHQIGIERIVQSCPDAVNYLKMACSILDGTEQAEVYFFMFGPGYAYFLSLLMVTLGRGFLPLLLINILMSSVSCLLVYKLAKDLTDSYPVAIISGIIVATSYTCITLSNTLLSDTLFYLLFAAGLIVFLKAHRSQRWSHFVIAGVLFGIAALVRAIAQFWPLAMIAISLAFMLRKRSPHTLRDPTGLARAFVKPAVCVLITAVIISGWVMRNYSVHGIPTLTTSGVFGLGKIAGYTEAEQDAKALGEVTEQRSNGQPERTGKTDFTPAELYNRWRADVLRVMRTYPSEMLSVYLQWTWRNMTAISRYHRSLLPDFKSTLIPLEYKITNLKLNYLCFWLSVLGFLMLLWQRKWKLAFVLGVTYLYFVPLVGLNPSQGSRLFFPAQIAWAILIAVVLVSAGRLVGRWFGRIWS